jgi:Ni/Fe-hydrogenase subunit HybB-like protein
MSEHLEDWADRPGIDWSGAFQRLVLILILLAIAVVLVVGTQNYDERMQVHFLLWSKEMRLITFFLVSVGIGVLTGEILRLLLRRTRRGNGPPPPQSRLPGVGAGPR